MGFNAYYLDDGPFSPARNPYLAERTTRRQPITRDTVGDWLDQLVAAGYEPEPMRIQYQHQRTSADQAKIDAAIDYIDALTGGQLHQPHQRSRHPGRIEER
jgi:hypothetical protein